MNNAVSRLVLWVMTTFPASTPVHIRRRHPQDFLRDDASLHTPKAPRRLRSIIKAMRPLKQPPRS